MPIQLKEVVDVLLQVDDDTNVWYDRKADTLKWHRPYAGDIDDEGAQTDRENCVNLPSRYEINDYRLMELFIERLDDGDAKDHLAASIVGRGAFRRFRGTAERFNLLNKWYDFRENCYISFAEKWCQRNNIPYVPYKKPASEFNEADFDLYDDEAFHITLADSQKKQAEEEQNSLPIAEVPEENLDLLIPLAISAEELRADHHHVLAADDNGTYAGFIVIDNTDRPYVVDMFVQRPYRRKGLGSALLKNAEKTYGNLLIHVDDPDFQARSFLQANGYKIRAIDFAK
jgi:GNAT superfamily N-acetyltransferase